MDEPPLAQDPMLEYGALSLDGHEIDKAARGYGFQLRGDAAEELVVVEDCRATRVRNKSATSRSLSSRASPRATEPNNQAADISGKRRSTSEMAESRSAPFIRGC